MVKRYLWFIIMSVIMLSACNRTKIMDIEDLASPSNYVDETMERLSDSSTDKDNQDNVGDFIKDFDKRVVSNTKIESILINDEARKAELKDIMRSNLSKVYTSIKYINRLNYDIVVGSAEKATRTVKDENKRDVIEEYLTGSTVYNRYIGDNVADITRNDKYYSSLYVNDKTNYGYNDVDVRETYLIDNGDKTISYSKLYDRNRDFPDKLTYKAYIVDRDLEAENISFSYLNVLDNGETYEIAEELNGDNSYFTYKTLMSFDRALEIANLNREILGLSDTGSYKTIVKLCFDRETLELKKAEIYLKETLDKIQKELDLGYSLQANSCKVEIYIISTENNTVVNIPDEVIKKLPRDVVADLERENSVDKMSLDDGLIMDGDFTVYGGGDTN